MIPENTFFGDHLEKISRQKNAYDDENRVDTKRLSGYNYS